MTIIVLARTCWIANFLASVCILNDPSYCPAFILCVECAMSRIIDFAAPLGQKAGTGHWNDLDMLEVGNGGMTHDEYSEHLCSAILYCC